MTAVDIERLREAVKRLNRLGAPIATTAANAGLGEDLSVVLRSVDLLLDADPVIETMTVDLDLGEPFMKEINAAEQVGWRVRQIVYLVGHNHILVVLERSLHDRP